MHKLKSASSGLLALALTAGLALTGAPASASTIHRVAPRDSCSSSPKQGGEMVASKSYGRGSSIQSFTFSWIELWYSPTCRTVWAEEEGGWSGDYFWVYNKDTGATQNADNPTTETGTISDANTQSHACMENDGDLGNENMPRTCTSWY
jgi:hypothetical protein